MSACVKCGRNLCLGGNAECLEVQLAVADVEVKRLKQQERILKRLATLCRGMRFKAAPFSDDPQGHGQEDEYERILEYVEPEEGWPQEVLP